MISSPDAMEYGASAQQPGNKNLCILVAGMHRSGTSALTRVLSLLGADLPKTLMAGTKSNQVSNATGHWESEALARLGDEILQSAGTDWHDPEPVATSWFQSVRYAEMRDRAVALLEQEYGDSPLFVFKDPRICRIVPFWLDVLDRFGATPKIVSIVRSPLEVAASLQARNGFDPSAGQMLWLRYTLDAERDSRESDRIFITYDQMLDDARRVADRIASEFDLIWPCNSIKTNRAISSFLSSEHRHHRKDMDGQADDGRGLEPLLASVYGTFTRWAEGGENADDLALLDRAIEQFDNAIRLLGDPVHASLVQSRQIHRFKVNRKELEARLREAEAKLEALEADPAESGEHLYIEARASIATLEGKLAASLADEQRAAAAAEDAQDLLVEARISIARLEEKLSASLVEQKRAIAEVSGLQKRLDSAVAAREKLLAEFHQIEIRRSRGEALLEVAEEKIGEQKCAIEALEAVRDEAARLEASLVAQIQQLREAEIDTAKTLQQREVHLELLTKTHDLLSSENEMARRVAGDLQARLDEQMGIASRSVIEIEALKARIAEQKVALEVAKAEKDANAADLQAGRKEISRLQHDLEAQVEIAERRQAAVVHLRQDRARKVHERDALNEELEEQARALQAQLDLAASFKPAKKQRAPIKEYIQRLFRTPGWRAAERRSRHLELLRSSTFFSPWWYLWKYDDVLRDRFDPAEHYLDHGAKEGRMPGPDFNGRWYLENNPDVREGGLNPLIHYLEHGRIEGRAIRSFRDSRTPRRPLSAPPIRPAAPLTPPPAPRRSVTNEAGVDQPARLEDSSTADLANAETKSWKTRSISFAELGQYADRDTVVVPSARANPFSQFLRGGEKAMACRYLAAIGGHIPVSDLPDIEATLLQALRLTLCGETVRIADAWFDQASQVRIRLDSSYVGTAIVQAFQRNEDGEIMSCGSAVGISEGQGLASFPLHSPYRPVSLVVTDAEGILVDSTLIAFPSLLRGGLHHGELAGPGSGRSCLEAGHEASQELLKRYLAICNGDALPAISSVMVDPTGAIGTEPLLGSDVLHWLADDLGLVVMTAPAKNPSEEAIAAQIETVGKGAASRQSAAQLSIPACAVPTLSAIFAFSGEMVSGAYSAIHMDPIERRAAYKITTGAVPQPDFVAGIAYGTQPPHVTGAETVGSPAHFPAAIYWTARPGGGDLSPYFPIAAGVEQPFVSPGGNERRLSVIVDCKDANGDLLPLLAAIGRLADKFVLDCVLVVAPQARSPVFSADFPFSITIASSAAENPIGRFVDAMPATQGDQVLLLDEATILHDPRTADALWSICGESSLGAASCKIVSESALPKGKTKTVATVGWIGLSGPDGDVGIARPDVTEFDLPVLIGTAAPDLRCTMVSRSVMQSFSDCDEVALGSMIDEQGLLSACITCFTASSSASAVHDGDSQRLKLPSHTLNIQRLLK